MEEPCLLAHAQLLPDIAQALLPRDGTAHSRLDPPVLHRHDTEQSDQVSSSVEVPSSHETQFVSS